GSPGGPGGPGGHVTFTGSQWQNAGRLEKSCLFARNIVLKGFSRGLLGGVTLTCTDIISFHAESVSTRKTSTLSMTWSCNWKRNSAGHACTDRRRPYRRIYGRDEKQETEEKKEKKYCFNMFRF
uniref:Uncharacterized protein n=1 Tax=Parascaris univalens TaxID=6257 RepID=A0A915A8U8_PARUN